MIVEITNNKTIVTVIPCLLDEESAKITRKKQNPIKNEVINFSGFVAPLGISKRSLLGGLYGPSGSIHLLLNKHNAVPRGARLLRVPRSERSEQSLALAPC